MTRSRSFRILAAFGFFAALWFSCETVDQTTRMKPSTPGPQTIQELTQRQPDVGVGIVIVSQSSEDNVRPYRASANRGDRLEWYSVDGDLRIEWRQTIPE